ncbi:MAG: hypothetical protein IJU80_07680, partial [Lachnospiraceae bacterium]|nr:hypothetical protein [Lachnospiraceae bacterium]
REESVIYGINTTDDTNFKPKLVECVLPCKAIKLDVFPQNVIIWYNHAKGHANCLIGAILLT